MSRYRIVRRPHNYSIDYIIEKNIDGQWTYIRHTHTYLGARWAVVVDRIGARTNAVVWEGE